MKEFWHKGRHFISIYNSPCNFCDSNKPPLWNDPFYQVKNKAQKKEWKTQLNESWNGGYKKVKHTKFSEKQTFACAYEVVGKVCFSQNLVRTASRFTLLPYYRQSGPCRWLTLWYPARNFCVVLIDHLSRVSFRVKSNISCCRNETKRRDDKVALVQVIYTFNAESFARKLFTKKTFREVLF